MFVVNKLTNLFKFLPIMYITLRPCTRYFKHIFCHLYIYIYLIFCVVKITVKYIDISFMIRASTGQISTWRVINLFRVIGAVLGWIAVSLNPMDDQSHSKSFIVPAFASIFCLVSVPNKLPLLHLLFITSPPYPLILLSYFFLSFSSSFFRVLVYCLLSFALFHKYSPPFVARNSYSKTNSLKLQLK